MYSLFRNNNGDHFIISQNHLDYIEFETYYLKVKNDTKKILISHCEDSEITPEIIDL